MCSFVKEISVAARASSLSKAQVAEVDHLLKEIGREVVFVPSFLTTHGDIDQLTALSSLGQTDFFTREVDERVLQGLCRIAIHSAKDLPEKIPEGLQIVALTKGVDPSDVIVMRDEETLQSLKKGAKVGTSSVRRQEAVRSLRSDLCAFEIRGTIEKRLSLLDAGEVDALIMAKAALIRLKLKRNIIEIPGPSAPMQGRLAILSRLGDREMEELFAPLHFP